MLNIESIYLISLTLSGWISGNLSVGNPFRLSSDYYLNKFAYFYGWVIFVLVAGIGIIFCRDNPEIYNFKPFSAFLSNFGSGALYYLVEMAYRVFAFNSKADLVIILNFIIRNQKYRTHRLFLIICSLISLLYVGFRIYADRLFYNYDVSVDSEGGRKLVEVVIGGVYQLIDVLGYIGSYFNMMLICFLGIMISGILENFFDRFKVDLELGEESVGMSNLKWAHKVSRSNNFKGHFQKNYVLRAYLEEFSGIKEIYKKFNGVAGTYACLLIFDNSFYIVTKLCDVSDPEYRDNIPYSVGATATSIIIVLCIVYMGTFMQLTIRRCKEQLRRHLLQLKLATDCEIQYTRFREVDAVVEVISNWNWVFSARGLFDINVALLPAITGTMMTYIIFMLQLKASENEPKPK